MQQKHSVIILLFNSEHELALQKRSSKDKSYPSHWDFSAAGGINSGEDHHAAAHRELKEELGIGADLEFLGEEMYKDDLCTDQLFIYKGNYDGEFQPDPVEVDEVGFFTFRQIEEMLSRGEKFHPEFKFLWDKMVYFD